MSALKRLDRVRTVALALRLPLQVALLALIAWGTFRREPAQRGIAKTVDPSTDVAVRRWTTAANDLPP